MSAVITAIAISAAATAGSIHQGRQASKQQRKSQAVQSKIEGRQMQRDRMQALREAQIARATGLQAAVTSGAADSSGLQGSQAGMQASALGNVAFSQQVDTGVGVMNTYNARAAKYMGNASTLQGVAQLASLGADFAATRPKKGP